MEYVTGLVPALAFQFVLNSTRLGLYETVDKLNFTRFDGEKHHSLSLCVIWGGICGVAGAAVILIEYILIWLLNDNNFFQIQRLVVHFIWLKHNCKLNHMENLPLAFNIIILE